MKRAILLDALGTLLELEPPAPALRRELRARFGLRIDDRLAHDAMAAEIDFYRRHLQEGRDRSALAHLHRRCTAVLREALGGPAAELGAVELQRALIASLRFVPYPDVLDALARLRAARLRLVVVSNWDCSLHDRLAECGIAARVNGILTSAELGVAKPSPAIFAHALTLAGVPPAEALHVGDSAAEDVAGARAAGIEPILVARSPSPRPAPGVRTVRSLAELLQLAA